MRRCILTVLSAGLLFFGGAISTLAADGNDEQRQRFLAAYERLEAGRSIDLAAEQRALAGYPLTPYLAYRDLHNRINRAEPREVRRFLDDHEGLPVSGLLHNRWLSSLGRRGEWTTFLEFDHGRGGAALACYRLRAERNAGGGIDDTWLQSARELWTVGHSQPNACDPVFAELYDRGALSAERRWQRIEQSMLAGNTGLARALRPRLGRDQQLALDQWLEVAANPARALRNDQLEGSTERGRSIVMDAFNRLARSDRDAARRLLDRYTADGRITADDAVAVQRQIALRAAYSRTPESRELLESLPSGARDASVLEWTARIKVGRQDWPEVIQAIEVMDEEQRGQSEWRYWLGHALLEVGQVAEAEVLLDTLSTERHYYGFLAADSLGRPYAMNHRPAARDAAVIAAVQQKPGVVRAREWLLLGYATEARREWHAALAGADAETWTGAAHLARDWGWYDRSVDAANRGGQHDDLELRFPLAYRNAIEDGARHAGVDPALVFALIRKESAFNPDARSRVGALGLMQVMPATGREVARRHGMGAPSTDDLRSPAQNLRLGNLYLAEMLTRFEGNMILAGAAYNAGPNRTEGWKTDNAGLPAAVWIENITFGETRDYVKSLLAFRAVFDWQLRGEARSLAAVMQTMPGIAAELDIALRDND
ncbi:soluble lytic murein transglycosylase [Natronocella acetinitrilica]|uniref:Soluble lytic murein transglycosylase n=1 Tax=Natronocella acetinitrilica TaxID=414046 RepID=A0AAE3KBX0_9GAMM|nr:transglycosylase SLT domain-containing protein [Natronocella acetinitrilica]MCP1675081.1 soluble lytic murein transglycosylase [Natronocella acetinitrilica]